MRCLSICKFLAAIAMDLLLAACASPKSNPQLNEGRISYPFVNGMRPVGSNGKHDKFVIRSAIGTSEYSVEIPDAGDGYDIQVPLAALNPPATSDALAVGAKGGKAPSPIATDKELVNTLPSLAKAKPSEIAVLDAAMGVGSAEGPIQSPSYTMGIAKVNQYYRERNFELALMEINNILSFYPNSPKLLKMKGTLLLKTGNHELAMKAWQRAVDLSPGDQVLDRAVKRLQERLVAMQPVGIRGPSLKMSEPASTSTPSTSLDANKVVPLDPEIEKLAH